MISSDKYSADEIHYRENYFVPFLLILTFIGVINSIQFYLHHINSYSGFFKISGIVITRLFFSIYFIVLLVQIPVHRKFFLNRSKILWLVYNLIFLFVFVFIHQYVFNLLNIYLTRHSLKMNIYELLINNQLVWIDISAYMLFLFSFYFLEYKKQLTYKELQQINLEVELLKSKLTELRVKIQPNFLFNSLDSLSGLIKSGRNKDANQKLALISNFLRETIYESEGDESTLLKELHYLKLYTEIVKITHGDEFDIIINLEANLHKAVLPHFFIQPIVEEFTNIATEGMQKISIGITINTYKNFLQIIFKSGFEIDKSSIDNSSVLNFVKERLERLYDENHLFNYNVKNGIAEVFTRVPLQFIER